VANSIANRVDPSCTPGHASQEIPMLDLAYIVIGAVFLVACVLYSLACEQL
jgi:hypothetical protein